MNRRTALGAIAVSPVLTASTVAASPAKKAVPVDMPTIFENAGHEYFAQKCFLALVASHSHGIASDTAERAFELADAFAAEAQRRRGY